MLRHIRNINFVKAILIAMSISLVIVISWQIGIGQFDFKRVVVICVLALALIFFIIFHAEFKKALLFLVFFGMVLGWRGIAITPQIYLYPSEVFIWLGFLLFLGQIITRNQDYVSTTNLPWAAILLGIAAILGIITAIDHSNQLAYAIGEAKTFIIFIPLLILLRQWVRSISDIRFLAKVMVITGFIIAILGILERYVPALVNIFPWLFTQPIEIRSNFLAGGLVELAGFSSWGTSVVAVFLVPLVGLWVYFFKQAQGFHKLSWGAVGMVLLIGIVVAGYRSAWLGLLMLALLLLLFERSSFFFLILVGITGLNYLPIGFINRFNTILLLENSGDTSILRRTIALKSSFNLIIQHPILGTGWNSPAAFNDWIYLALAMGLLAVVIFVGWYGTLLIKLLRIRLARFNATDNGIGATQALALAFMAGLTGYSICMVSGAMSQVPPLMTGFWLIFCLAWRFTEIASSNTTQS